MTKSIDLIEAFSTFANDWSMKNHGCAGTLFLLSHESSQQGLQVVLDSNVIYDRPEEIVQTISHSSFSFRNTSNTFENQQILIQTTTPISESWKLTQSVCPIGNSLFKLTIPIHNDIPGGYALDTIQISNRDIFTHAGSYTWNIDQTIRLLPHASTKVTFQTKLAKRYQDFNFMYNLTGSIGVTSRNSLENPIEIYFPVTQVLQWIQSDLLTLDFEENKVSCLNKGRYMATYHVHPQLLIQAQSINNPTIVQETVLPIPM